MPKPKEAKQDTDREWKAFAADILNGLLENGCGDWSHRTVRDVPPRKAAKWKPRKKLTGEDHSGFYLDDIDSMLDELEAEAFGPVLPPCPETAIFGTDPRLPRATAALAAVQIAKHSGSADSLRTALCGPLSLTHIATGAAEQVGIITKMLSAMFEPEGPCYVQDKPKIFSVTDVMALQSKPRSAILADFTDDFQICLIENRRIILVSTTAQDIPAALTPLVTQKLVLPPVDGPMLNAIFQLLFPGAKPVTIPDDDPALENTTAEALTLCARAHGPAAALAQLRKDKVQLAQDGPSLANFPLPATVREPLDQLIADLADWRSGKIGWQDVQRGILLYGPPGCGKTEIPRLIAKSVNIPVFAGSMATWQSETARASDICREMRLFFNKAKAAAPAVLFIDELDSFGDRARPQDQNSSWTDMVIGGLLECLDGYNGLEGVVVIAATNHLYKIDAALRRPGRFDRVVSIDHPTPDLMPQAFRWHLHKDLEGVDLGEAALAATGMAGAEVAATVRDARAIARRHKRELVVDDLLTAIRNRRPFIDKSLHWQIAIHECGHAIAGYLVGRAIPHLLTIHGNGGAAAMSRVPSALRRADYEKDIVLLMGGRAAEKLVFDAPSGGAGGDAESDLAQATKIATAIESSYGLGDSGLVWDGSPEQAFEKMRFDRNLRDRVQRHLEAAERTAMTILQTHHKQLLEMAQSLLETGALTGAALQEFLSRLNAGKIELDHDSSGAEAQDQEKMVADQEKLEPS
jgi:cell division protease FtsH